MRELTVKEILIFLAFFVFLLSLSSNNSAILSSFNDSNLLSAIFALSGSVPKPLLRDVNRPIIFSVTGRIDVNHRIIEKFSNFG